MSLDLIPEGLVVSLVGVMIVVAVLSLISFLLSLLKYINKPESKKAEEVSEKTICNEKKVEIKEEENDLELIAVITAVIAANLNTSTDKLIVRSFKKVTQWSEVAKKEYKKI